MKRCIINTLNEIENEDIAHKTKYIKFFYFKLIIITVIDDIFPDELVFIIINEMHYNRSILHKIPIIEEKEGYNQKMKVKFSNLPKEQVIERLKYQFGENKIKIIQEKGYEIYRIEIIEKYEKYIIIKYMPNNIIVHQGKLAINNKYISIVNLCLTND